MSIIIKYITCTKDEITTDNATPFNPYMFPNTMILTIWVDKYNPDPIITILLFSEPKYFEIYVEAIADGTIETLIIWITTIASVNWGNNIGRNIGDSIILSRAKIIDMIIIIFLTNLVEFPLASCVNAYENSIPGIKYNNPINCNPSW